MSTPPPPSRESATAADRELALLAEADALAFPAWIDFKARLPEDVKEHTHGSHYQAFRAGCFTGIKDRAAHTAAACASRDWMISAMNAEIVSNHEHYEAELTKLRAEVERLKAELQVRDSEVAMWKDALRGAREELEKVQAVKIEEICAIPTTVNEVRIEMARQKLETELTQALATSVAQANEAQVQAQIIVELRKVVDYYAAGGNFDGGSYASIAAAAAARLKTLSQCSDIVRKHYPEVPR